MSTHETSYKSLLTKIPAKNKTAAKLTPEPGYLHNEDGGEYLVNPGGHVLDALAENTDANVTLHVYVPIQEITVVLNTIRQIIKNVLGTKCTP